MRDVVGVVGLGSMGAPMARCLLRAGFETTVFDVNEAVVAPLTDVGAIRAPSLRELAAAAAFVSVVVAGEQTARDVIASPDGLIAHLQPGSVILLHTTLDPQVITDLASAAASAGIDLLDASVSGGRERAETADLTLMVGGPEPVVERARAVLGAFGTTVHLGPLGAGAVVKLANNILFLATKIAAIEAFQLVRAYGLDETTVRNAILCSTGDSWVMRNWDEGDAILMETDGAPSATLWSAAAAARAVDEHLPAVALLSELQPSTYQDRLQYLLTRQDGAS